MVPKIGIIDYGSGNIASVTNALKKHGYERVFLVSQSFVRNDFDLLILPGVGSFGYAMKQLKNMNLVSSLHEFYAQNGPIIGICLGMQLFAKNSEESVGCEGLGFVEGSVKKIRFSNSQKVPSIGWFRTSLVFDEVIFNAYFYHVHSYHLVFEDLDVTNISTYQSGGTQITSAFLKDNIIGMQFHPERSGETGVRLLGTCIERLLRLRPK